MRKSPIFCGFVRILLKKALTENFFFCAVSIHKFSLNHFFLSILGHAVGFWHEQNRPDRSIYIDVIYDNVDSSKYINFDLRGPNEINTFDQVITLSYLEI